MRICCVVGAPGAGAAAVPESDDAVGDDGAGVCADSVCRWALVMGDENAFGEVINGLDAHSLFGAWRFMAPCAGHVERVTRHDNIAYCSPNFGLQRCQ